MNTINEMQWELQFKLNGIIDERLRILEDTVLQLINAIEDNETDMQRMADEINRLNKLLKEKES